MIMTLLAHIRRGVKKDVPDDYKITDKGKSKKRQKNARYIKNCFSDLGSVVSGYLSVASPLLGIFSEVLLGFALVFLILLMSTDISMRVVDTSNASSLDQV